MSHFFAIAIIPVNCDNPEQYVAEMLEPYNENREVESYDKSCWCVGNNVRDEINSLVELGAGNVGEYREKHNSLRVQLNWEENYNPEHGALSSELWQARWAVRDKVERAVKAHMESRMEADPKCTDCGGTGISQTTYNPNSKWDWYSFGGRWNGTIRNEYRGDDRGFNFGDEYRQFGDNVIHVDDYCNLLEDPETRETVRSFAVITPDGEWLEKGKMGWFACVSDEQDPDDWIDCLITTFDQYRDGYVAVGLDLHI